MCVGSLGSSGGGRVQQFGGPSDEQNVSSGFSKKGKENEKSFYLKGRRRVIKIKIKHQRKLKQLVEERKKEK